MANYSITVLVAIYKAGKFITDKIKNLQDQTIFKDTQIVLLNCQNLHDERNAYSEFLKLPNVIEISYQTHIGLYATWNDGIKLTNSEFICNSNVDDMWHPTYLQNCIEYLTNNSTYSIVSSGILITNTPNQTDHLTWKNEGGKIPFFQYPQSTAGPCPVWRRDLHDKYGYFDDRCAVIGDAIMWEKWLENNEQFGLIDKNLVLYYASGESLERRIDPETNRWVRELDLERIGRPVKSETENAETENTQD